MLLGSSDGFAICSIRFVTVSEGLQSCTLFLGGYIILERQYYQLNSQGYVCMLSAQSHTLTGPYPHRVSSSAGGAGLVGASFVNYTGVLKMNVIFNIL